MNMINRSWIKGALIRWPRHLKLIYTIYIPRCHGNCWKIYRIHKLKEGYSRLDWDITEIKKPLIVSGALKSCYIEHGRCKVTMQALINWHCCRPNPSTKTLRAKATNLSRILRASCNGRYFRSLNLLAWTDLSQQRCGSATTMPISYSDANTFKSSADIYQLRPGTLVYMDDIHLSASSQYNLYIYRKLPQ